MHKRYLTAAALLALTNGVHVFLGGPEVHQPLLSAGPTAELDLYISVLWHFVTLVMALGTAALALAAWRPEWRSAGITVGAISAGFAALFLAYGLMQLGEPWTAPQWTVFAAIAALALWPAAKREAA